ncbi:hypothetical protein BACI71_120351 [Bacillus mycoides]|uniref:Uncharacterized protein n=1 Tax=Bacillus mycoides TaxID=1405 RepID=A0A653TAP9_BACMY|nr:hypothetical protein BACI71_120351 [Bacillus mycoides]
MEGKRNIAFHSTYFKAVNVARGFLSVVNLLCSFGIIHVQLSKIVAVTYENLFVLLW